jgi:hypothetical protein
VLPTADAVGFPKIPGITYTGTINRAAVIHHEVMPPAKGASYPVFVPKTDADGRDLAGLRLPTLEAPIATYLGWNLRKAGFGEGELCDINGSMLPFAATPEERLKNNDPCRSIAERYPKNGDRAAVVAKAAQALLQDRLLLEEDAKLFAASAN